MDPKTPTRVFAALALAAAAATALPAHAAGSVLVRYVQPEQFADIGFGSFERDRTLQSLTDYLGRLGRQLPDGQTLQLDVTDVDLAGSIEPWRTNSIRVMRGRADWPNIALRYTLQQGGSTLKSGEARLHDMNYMMTRPTPDVRDGELSYEKRMLKKWFDATFAAPTP